MTPTEEIKSRLSVEEVVREYVKINQVGQNWKGLCPFHNEKTPSFMVTPERQIWHCFGCGEGGDIFTFIMKIEGVEFSEALKILAKKAGVELKPQNPKQVNLKNKLLDINDLAKKFYAHLLKTAPQAKQAREYLEKRKVSAQAIEKFELGFAPDSWDVLKKFLTSRNYSEKEIFDAGLLVEKTRGGGYYDRFRNRLMFPINNLHAQTVGFSARTLNPDENAKYLNSPQTIIYNKSEILYGLDKAKQEIRKRGAVILVEGQMDLISAHEAGSINTAATSGTALTADQIRLLKRYSDNILLALDTDSAGSKATLRGSAIAALAMGANVKVITLPKGKDPDECIKESPEGWFLAIKNAKHYLENYINQALGNFDKDSVEGKKAIVDFMDILAKVPNKIEQDHFIKKLAQKINVQEIILREELDKKDNTNYNGNHRSAVSVKSIIRKKRDVQIAEQIIALFLKYPKNLDYFGGRLNSEILADEKIIKIYKELLLFYKNNGDSFNFDAFVNQFKKRDEELANSIETLFLLGEKDFLNFEENKAMRQLAENINSLEASFIKKRKKSLEEKIKEAEKDGDEELANELLGEIGELGAKLVELDNEFENI